MSRSEVVCWPEGNIHIFSSAGSITWLRSHVIVYTHEFQMIDYILAELSISAAAFMSPDFRRWGGAREDLSDSGTAQHFICWNTGDVTLMKCLSS